MFNNVYFEWLFHTASPELINRLREEEGLNIKMYWIPPGDLGYAKYFVIRNSKYTWILQLDADFIYYDCAPKYI